MTPLRSSLRTNATLLMPTACPEIISFDLILTLATGCSRTIILFVEYAHCALGGDEAEVLAVLETSFLVKNPPSRFLNINKQRNKEKNSKIKTIFFFFIL